MSVPYSVQEEFKRACLENAGCFKRPEEAEREIIELEKSLLGERNEGARNESDQNSDSDYDFVENLKT